MADAEFDYRAYAQQGAQYATGIDGADQNNGQYDNYQYAQGQGAMAGGGNQVYQDPDTAGYEYYDEYGQPVNYDQYGQGYGQAYGQAYGQGYGQGYDQQAQEGYQQGYGQTYDPNMQYDQYGQPIQFDEQGNAYDCYGNVIYQDYYGQPINYGYYGADAAYADPYGVGAAQAVQATGPGYDPQQGAQAPKTELHVEATIPKKKKKSDTKKKKRPKQYVVTTGAPSAGAPVVSLGCPAPPPGSEITVYPSQYPEWLASVAASQAMDAGKPCCIPTACAPLRNGVVYQTPCPSKAIIHHAAPFPSTIVHAAPSQTPSIVHQTLPPPRALIHQVPSTSTTAVEEACCQPCHMVNGPAPKPISVVQVPPAHPCGEVRRRFEVIPAIHPPPGGIMVTGLQAFPGKTRTSPFPCCGSGKQHASTVRPFVATIPPSCSPVVIGAPRTVEVTETPAACTPPTASTVRFVNPCTKQQSAMQVVCSAQPTSMIRKYNVQTNGKPSAAFIQRCEDSWATPNTESRNDIIHSVVRLAPERKLSHVAPFKKNVANRRTPPEVYVVQSEIRPRMRTIEVTPVKNSCCHPGMLQLPPTSHCHAHQGSSCSIPSIYVADQKHPSPPNLLVQPQQVHGARLPTSVPQTPIAIVGPTPASMRHSHAVIQEPSLNVNSISASNASNSTTSSSDQSNDELVDTVVDENLRLQRDVASLRRQLDKTLGVIEPSSLTLPEQNAALRRQLKELGKAVHEFTTKAPQNDAAAKLIAELTLQLNNAVEDLEATQMRLMKKESEFTSLKKDHKRGKKGEQEFLDVSSQNIQNVVYRSPMEADDVRHEMGLVDDLVAQCQRIIAEATDQLWSIETAVRDVVDKIFASFGLGSDKDESQFGSQKSRQQFLEELHQLIDTHLNDVFEARQDMDRLQENIDTIKGKAWDPKRNIPYCGCRPRRDVLEDDVSHLMERLHEAADQSCKLRERLLATELKNLTLIMGDQQSGENARVAVSRAIKEAHMSREKEALEEKVQNLESQLQRLRASGVIKSNRISYPFGSLPETAAPKFPVVSPEISLQPIFKENAFDNMKTSIPPSLKKLQLGRSSNKNPNKNKNRPEMEKEERPAYRPTKAEREHQKEIATNLERQENFKKALIDDLEAQERRLLGLQNELSNVSPGPLNPEEWTGARNRIVSRMQTGGRQLQELINKLDANLAQENDLGLAYSISMDLTDLAAEAQASLDLSKLTEKERNILLKIQHQAQDLLKTNMGLQKYGKGKLNGD